jgi:hypothetical protein
LTTRLTRTKAEAHEALYPALAKLTAQMEAMAARNPAARVPPAARAAAADLLFEAQQFGWNRGGRTQRPLPEPAADIGGLSTQLGQALALLDAFEAAHCIWNADLKCFVWETQGAPLPVRRLRQEPARPQLSERDKRRSEQRRLEIMRKIEAKAEDSYDLGYADASSGHEHRRAAR